MLFIEITDFCPQFHRATVNLTAPIFSPQENNCTIKKKKSFKSIATGFCREKTPTSQMFSAFNVMPNMLMELNPEH